MKLITPSKNYYENCRSTTEAFEKNETITTDEKQTEYRNEMELGLSKTSIRNIMIH